MAKTKFSLQNVLETVGSIYIQTETIRNGASNGAGNSASEFQHVTTGVDSDGTTLIAGRLVSGVSNGKVLAGLLVLTGIAGLTYVWATD
ncbi:MAG: hypothetical protein COA96_14160 [SAR86 cluster bacterium]|uniref:Uncharacterized protein n=1 Tax=SAR86 cluster bacterium TaxID=2030880 RepID=A0A2A5ATG0_9GAMM|nr:MAG: hypothetical protein COA96_14160 [SAR86 cluster bacterium]